MEELNKVVFQFFNGFAEQSEFIDSIIIFFAEYLAYILIAVFLIALIFGKTDLVQKLKLFLSAAISGILCQDVIVPVIRFFYHHPRPFVAIDNVHKLFPELGYSFPSAHATFFFALSTVVYRENKTLGIIFFISSSLMGIARITSGVHYPLDILGGAALGIVAGFSATSLIKAYFIQRQKRSDY